MADKKMLLFAGTTEGRELAFRLTNLPVTVFVSTATEYGRECVGSGGNIRTMAGRMDDTAISTFIEKEGITLAVDATHPFAAEVTSNIKKACIRSRIPYIRCLREREDTGGEESRGMVFMKSVKEAVEYLDSTEGNILITTGSKELALYTQIRKYKDRCYARVLSTAEAVEDSVKQGFKGAHLIAMQGPFSKEMNAAMIKYTDARYIVTKESGHAGGFAQKAAAAREEGAVLVVIGRPEEEGLDLKQTLDYIDAYAQSFDFPQPDIIQ